MMVSANIATCVPIDPSVAGPIARKKARTSSSSRNGANRGRPPWRATISGEQEILQETRDQHAPRCGVTGGREEGRQRQRRHHREVEKDRRRRGSGKAVHHIEHAAIQRHQRDQQQVGKGDARELDGKPALFGSSVKPGARTLMACGMNSQRHDQQHHLRQKKQGEDAIGEQSRRGLAALPWTWA